MNIDRLAINLRAYAHARGAPEREDDQEVAYEAARDIIEALLKQSCTCSNCDGAQWVCENHADRPWGGLSTSGNACDCGAGMPCGACNLASASASYSEPWRELALRGVQLVESAVDDTCWGQPTFGPDYGEELREAYDALLNAQAMEARSAETTGSARKGDSAVHAPKTPIQDHQND